MIREIVHFFSVAPEAMKLQKALPRAQFVDTMTTRADEQGFDDLRRRVVDGLHGRVLEVGHRPAPKGAS